MRAFHEPQSFRTNLHQNGSCPQAALPSGHILLQHRLLHSCNVDTCPSMGSSGAAEAPYRGTCAPSALWGSQGCLSLFPSPDYPRGTATASELCPTQAQQNCHFPPCLGCPDPGREKWRRCSIRIKALGGAVETEKG